MIQKSLMVTGIIIAVISLGLHLGVPGSTRSGLMFEVEPHSTEAEHITFDLTNVDYSFGIDIIPMNQGASFNSSVYLLNSTEYSEYLTGTPIADVDALMSFSDVARHNWRILEYYYTLSRE